jgi:glycosyltransferase involved in cell wall biosynthesis
MSALRVLMIAYHFPPLAGSSGIQRTLRFVQHLPALGWEPLVLSAHPIAYERSSTDLLQQIPVGTVVRRAWALDNARHLSIAGRHVAAWSRPDRWRSWHWDAVRVGRQMIARYAPQAIFSTYPIATAHGIAAALQRHSGLPWVADFRDPMAQDGYPSDPLTWQSFARIESLAVRQAAAWVFTTQGALRMYRERYPEAAERMRLIENGYDEESFATAEQRPRQPLVPGALTVVHSGIVYPSERDPRPLFAALQRMKDSGRLDNPRFVIRFRAPVHDALLGRLAAAHGVQDHVEVCPPVGYQEALAEMLCADALLLMQAANCNEQVPAKAYEYLRARRPILCLSDAAGDTVGALRAAGIRRSAALESAQEIEALLGEFIVGARDGLVADEDAIRGASRRARAAALCRLLHDVQAGPAPAAAG